MEVLSQSCESDLFSSLSRSSAPLCSRLIIVANSLPVRKLEDAIGYHPTKLAGIVPAVQQLKSSGAIKDFLFIGNTPCFVKPHNIAQLKYLSCIPVTIPKNTFDSYYAGYCKSSLWPLLHYRLHLVKHNAKCFEAYVQVNQAFADVILSHCKEGDVIWIHDYHFLLLPNLLREKIPRGVPIGFFFHVPFPSSELFRVLPNRTELLNGVLGSDLIGFQTFEYVRHFESTVSRLIGAECMPRGIEAPGSGHFVRINVFPGGIDFKTFEHIASEPKVKDRIDQLTPLFKDKLVIVSRDRVNEIEGVPIKLHVIEKLFQKYPQWKGKIVYFQIYEPIELEYESEESKTLSKEVNEIVGRLNGVFGTVDYVPIEYVHKNLEFEEICALYCVADVGLMTPIRDGLNLVSHEYVACQNSRSPGVLILSEFTGAARCLAGARLVNPFDTNDFVEAVNEALTLSEEDRIVKHEYNYDYVRGNTSTDWGKVFFDELCLSITDLINHPSVPLLDIDMVGCAYARSTKDRLFLLDYDGTLSPMARLPKLANPSAEVVNILTKLSKNPRNKVYIISGRDTVSLETWLGHLDVGLSCEHGAFFRLPGAKDWQKMVDEQEHENHWRQSIISIMEDFADRTPGSFVEMKQVNIAWHFRNSDPEYGDFQARELVMELQAIANKYPVDIIRGKKTIEVKLQSASKGKIVQHILERVDADFVFCAGDDKTDEEMFVNFTAASNSTHFTCCVMTDAKRITQAKYFVETFQDVVDTLSELMNMDEKADTKINNKFLAPVGRQLRRNSLLGFGASSLRDKKKKYTPTSLLGSCGIVQQAQHLQE